MRRRTRLLAGLLLGLLGFSLVAQARQTQSGSLTSLSQSDLVRLLDDVTRRADRLDTEAADLERTSQELQTGTDRAATAEKAARQRLDVLGILAGTLPAEGPGISLRIEDPKRRVPVSELLDTVQELRDAGAEAIQLGDVRVVASTSFVDVPGGSGANVDAHVLTPPYLFVVLGDPQTLQTALEIPGGVLETLRQSEASGTVRRGAELTVPAVRQISRPQYALPKGSS